MICCVGVVYSGEYVCDVALSAYPHRASLKNMPGQHHKHFKIVYVFATQLAIHNFRWS
jgi:hypothetical protein